MKHMYYGYGKGKTSTLNGSAMRAKGAGFKVCYIRFLKSKSSEDKYLNEICDKFITYPMPGNKFVWHLNQEELKSAHTYFQDILSNLHEQAKGYDMVILDEFSDLIVNKFVTEQQIIDFIESLRVKHILISGHAIHDKLFEKMDLITHFNKEKHYFDKGVMARKGIEL